MDLALLSSSIILSLILITKGSDWLTESVEPLAHRLKTSNVAIGIVLVSAIVSLPEILVALMAGMEGFQDISLGVIFGSILCNIGLMTGLNAMIRPLHVTRTLILRDGILSVVIPLLVFSISQGGTITRMHGLSMVLLFIPYLMNVYLQEKAAGAREQQKEKKEVEEELKLIEMGVAQMKPGWMSFTLGITILLIGTFLFSNQLIRLTTVFGIDELFVGLTLGAIIPSLPNIITAFQATRKGLTEVSVSETIGANIFTLLVTIGILTMVTPIDIHASWLIFDIPAMVIMSFLLFISMVTDQKISRFEGALLLGLYLVILLTQIKLTIS